MGEPIYGVACPEGACKVRLRTRFARAGGTPVITCDQLTEEAVQAALDGSEGLAKYLRAYGRELGLRRPPYTLKVELQYLGSDGGAIDAPTEVEVTYYGAGGKEKAGGSKALRLAERAVRSTERIALGVLRERRADRRARAKETLTLQKELAEVIKAAGEAHHKTVTAASEPMKHLSDRVTDHSKHESDRADAANKKLVSVIEARAQEDDDIFSSLAKLAPFVPLGKELLGKIMKNN